ncbi:RNA 2',3'-cyclic phosphodiesterase [Thermobrachium celere]|uniref:RNA 2',3'-cyclic phosphodiesterase n=1 Tax=Thermobrachium celere TaxID=53422 RepID=UPI0019439AE7|nr:RNA 2',3'-cyclic phosphodiesterase [Thermobrachium celere]GFR34982.1 2'-5' RNA ligase [Thermobrachium celere]
MHTFITFDFDRETKEKIYRIQSKIKEGSIKGRFKYIDNFHLTIKFLGETDETKIGLIYQDLLRKLKGKPKISIYLKGLGSFGKGEVIKTIYLKCHGELDKVYEIAKEVDKITSNYGFKMENRFTPHVTIAQEVLLKDSFEELQISLEDEKIDNIILDKVIIMKSEQKNGKRIYTPLYILPLE